MWHGKRKNKNYYHFKGDTYMSKLWKQMVNWMDEIGELSGCHRMPERSFFYKGHQFPVCARCTGVSIGQFAAVIFNFFLDIPAAISFIFLGSMGIDWLLQETGIKKSNNYRRLFTGILGGFGLFNLYCIIFKRIKSRL